MNSLGEGNWDCRRCRKNSLPELTQGEEDPGELDRRRRTRPCCASFHGSSRACGWKGCGGILGSIVGGTGRKRIERGIQVLVMAIAEFHIPVHDLLEVLYLRLMVKEPGESTRARVRAAEAGELGTVVYLHTYCLSPLETKPTLSRGSTETGFNRLAAAFPGGTYFAMIKHQMVV